MELTARQCRNSCEAMCRCMIDYVYLLGKYAHKPILRRLLARRRPLAAHVVKQPEEGLARRRRRLSDW